MDLDVQAKILQDLAVKHAAALLNIAYLRTNMEEQREMAIQLGMNPERDCAEAHLATLDAMSLQQDQAHKHNMKRQITLYN